MLNEKSLAGKKQPARMRLERRLDCHPSREDYGAAQSRPRRWRTEGCFRMYVEIKSTGVHNLVPTSIVEQVSYTAVAFRPLGTDLPSINPKEENKKGHALPRAAPAGRPEGHKETVCLPGSSRPRDALQVHPTRKGECVSSVSRRCFFMNLNFSQ